MAAAAVTSNINSTVSTPRRLVSSSAAIKSDSQRAPTSPAYSTPSTGIASSSRSQLPAPPQPPPLPPPPTTTTTGGMTQPSSLECAPMTLKRLLRSPFEHTVRSGTRVKSKPKSGSGEDLTARITTQEGNGGAKGGVKKKEGEGHERAGVLKSSRVALGRTRKASGSGLPSSSSRSRSRADECEATAPRFRLPALTSWVHPSQSLASLSSPTLSDHQPSSSSSPPPSSPNRPIISPPAPLSPKRPSVPDANPPPSPSSPQSRRHHHPPHLPSSSSSPSLILSPPSPAPNSPTRPTNREPVSPPGTPTPTPSARSPQHQRQQLGKRTSPPLNHPPSSPPSSPSTRSTSSPRARSPPSSRVVTPRGFTSASASSLNYPPSYASNAIRGSSLDRSPSPALPRASSPSSPSRPRALSPSRQHQLRTVSPSAVLTRHPNTSTPSISSQGGPSNPMHREAVRLATSELCREMLRPGQSTGLGVRESDQVEVRMRALARLERMWVKSGASANGSVSQLGAPGSRVGGSTATSTAGEERERRLFTEALRDGYVLCQLMNKLRPGSIARIDPREDGKLRMSNVTKFLASCSANGLSSDDLFHRDDLIEATSDSLARVARTVIALVKWADTPVPTQSRLSRDRGNFKSINTSVVEPSTTNAPPPSLGSPYRTPSSSRAVMSSPNLSAHSPSRPPRSPTRTNTRRWTPPSVGIPTLRSASPDPAASSSSDAQETDGHETPTRTSDRDEVPPILPPRSPMRSRLSERSLSLVTTGGESPLVPSPLGECGVRVSVADSTTTNQSIASSNLTETTTYSSLLDAAIGGGAHGGRSSGAYGGGSNNKFGTIRTVTTEATSFVLSEWPSMTRTEASAVASSLMAGAAGDESSPGSGDSNSINHNSPSNNGGGMLLGQRRRSNLNLETAAAVRPRERRPSETVPVDLSRVVEESEEPVSGGRGSSSDGAAARWNAALANGRVERIKLGQGKWADDFLHVLQAQNNHAPSRPIAIKRPSRSSLTASASASPAGHDELDLNTISTPSALSSLPPNLLGSSLSSSWSQPSPLATRRPTHRARHSVDTPMLAPKDSLFALPRDSSPDSAMLGGGSGLLAQQSSSSSSRMMLRRNSARGGITGQRNGIYVPRRSSPENNSANGGSGGGGDNNNGDPPFAAAVPFPRAVSGEYVLPSPSSLNAFCSPLSLSDSVVERERSIHNSVGSGGSGSAVGGGGGGSSASGSTHLPPTPRGRFQSEVDGASSRRPRPRPNSYDEFGAKPSRRSRFESMVNLGVASGEHPSASDLMARDMTEGSMSRQTLVVREEGKSPTHFQLGNCIGRGQFGSVYRALNLNTGQMVAVKRIGLDGLKEEEISQLMREVDLVKRLSHPSIVKYEGMARDENTLSIVLEYAENGSLGQTLKAFGKLNEKLVASYVVKILEGLDYLHRSDVVHCDLKAANILTTKTGNVKLSDFGVSLNLRAMEREIKDVAGTPNWMAPEVIELKGASTKSDIWSLGCTVIELLTGRPPYGDIANAMTVMFRIVEDDCPPIPERLSDPLVAFLKECFHKDPALRPSAEELFEHEWLKNLWGLNKDLRPQDSIPFLRRVSADLQKNEAARHLIANLDRDRDREQPPYLVLDSPLVSEFVRVPPGADDMVLSSSPGHRSFVSASPVPGSASIPEVLPQTPTQAQTQAQAQAEPDLFDVREHTFVKTTFGKPVSCRVCMDPVKKGAVLCSHCSLICHSKCAGRAPPTCDLRSKLLMHAQFAQRGSSPADIFITRFPPPPPPGASSSRGSFERERTGTGTNSPQPLSASSPAPAPTQPHPPVAYKVFSAPFKRSRASPSNSSTSLTGATSPPPFPPVSLQQQQQPRAVKSLLPEGSVIRRKLSIILTRQQRDPQLIRDNVHNRPRPLSMASISSSSSPPHSNSNSDSQQSNSLRSLQTAAESISSGAASGGAPPGAAGAAGASGVAATAMVLRASVYSGMSTVPDDVDDEDMSPPLSSSLVMVKQPKELDVSRVAPPAAVASVAAAAAAASKAPDDTTTNNNTTRRMTMGRRGGRGSGAGSESNKNSGGNCAIQ